MLTTSVIAFREFFEAFLIVGIFLGISRNLHLKRELEILLAAGVGILVSLLLAAGTYFFGDHARALLTEETVEFLEGYLLVFSGLFLAYVVFSLHGVISRGRKEMLAKAQERFQERVFDISLFFTIVFLVMREGFEIALFTASVSLFATFIQNFLGLLLGLLGASVIGISTFFAFIRFPIQKIFRVAEWMIILLGASLTQNGITKLFETHLSLDLSAVVPFGFSFLPDEDTFLGHVLHGMFGIDQEFSLVRLCIMLLYVFIIFLLFKKRKNAFDALSGKNATATL